MNFAYINLTKPDLKVRRVHSLDELKDTIRSAGKANIRCFKWNASAELWTEFQIS